MLTQTQPIAASAEGRNHHRRTKLVLLSVGVATVVLVAGAIGFAQSDSSADVQTSATGPVVVPDDVAQATSPSGQSLDTLISGLQTRLETVPGDYVSWATLGLAYVQQAKVTVNSDFYPKADGALAKSIELNDDENYVAYAGLSALAAARHEFAAAKSFAERGLEINPYSALLYGALSDAETQLGNYDAAFAAVQRMVDLSPDTASLSRASYTWELRGDVEQARALMQRALDDAPTPADRAFALFYLGELAFNNGDPASALDAYNRARDASPSYVAALAGKAKAEAALGQVETALDHYAELVGRAPEPGYVLEYGELLESLGRVDEAQQQYDVFVTTQQLFAVNGVQPDAVASLFETNHGDPASGLALARAGVDDEPFVAMYDAHAWALHMNDRDEEALEAIEAAMQLGERNALFRYHAGMIRLALGDIDGARSDLSAALAINPAFNPLAAPIAAATLADLGGPIADMPGAPTEGGEG